MPGNIEDFLKMAAELQDFAAPEDELTALLRGLEEELEEDELSMDELETVVAASKGDDYERFKTLLKETEK